MYEETGAGELSRKMPFSTQLVDPPGASVNTRWGPIDLEQPGGVELQGMEGTAALVSRTENSIENTGYLV